jgi:uncharacterized membrane protein
MTLLRASLSSLALSLALALVACGDDGSGADAGDPVDCDAAAVPRYSEMSAVWAKCTNCHASTLSGAARNAAPIGVDFDTHAAAKAEAADAVKRVEDGTMPPANQPQLTAEEEEQLIRWASCGTPE